MTVPGMELYVKFMGTLAFGVVGVGLVLKVLLETLFNDWDALNDIYERFQAWISGKHQVQLLRPEDILLEAEKRGQHQGSTRLVDIRREQLRQLDEVDARLAKARQLAPVTR
jgi:hypothetical protein